MAVIDTNKNSKSNDDRDSDVSIGLQLPLFSETGANGWTRTTIEAVKENLKNLLNTETGERLMQPNLGVKLKDIYLNHFQKMLYRVFKVSLLKVWIIGCHLFRLMI